MRILLLAENLGSGGAERQLCGLAIMLHQEGFLVKIVTYYKSEFSQFYEPILNEASVDYELHTELLPPKTRVWRFAKLARRFKPDVVIAFLPGPSKMACLAKPFCKYKLIVGERNTNLSLKMFDRVRFNIFRLADAVVPNSFSQGEFITKHYPSFEKKVHSIVNFIDAEKFSPSKTRNTNSVFNILTVARFVPQKNYFNYAEAIAIVKAKGYRFHCDWYGNKYSVDYVEPLQLKIKQLGLEEFVTLHDPSSEILKIYQSADALCLPSIYEGYPNVLCEAMACGLPVICSNVQEMSRIVKDSENGFLFDPYNPESIADAIVMLLESSSSRRHEMAMKNREKILQNNTKKVFVSKYISLINDLLNAN